VKVEGFHFDMRKRLVEFDDVANQQRDIIYKLRNRILETKDIKDEVLEKLEHQIEKILTASFMDGKPDYEKILGNFLDIVPFDDTSIRKIREQVGALSTKEEIQEFLSKVVYDIHTTREKQIGSEVMRQIEIYAYLGSIDHLWIDHIDHIDDLREAVSLRAYGQRDPLVEFKNEAYTLFENLIERIDEELSHRLFRIQVGAPQSEIPLAQARTNEDTLDQIGVVGNANAAAKVGDPAFKTKVGRNDPCPCGSGKKYKHCHYPQYG
jgi:preprotein translocase subunit SecA